MGRERRGRGRDRDKGRNGKRSHKKQQKGKIELDPHYKSPAGRHGGHDVLKPEEDPIVIEPSVGTLGCYNKDVGAVVTPVAEYEKQKVTPVVVNPTGVKDAKKVTTKTDKKKIASPFKVNPPPPNTFTHAPKSPRAVSVLPTGPLIPGAAPQHAIPPFTNQNTLNKKK